MRGLAVSILLLSWTTAAPAAAAPDRSSRPVRLETRHRPAFDVPDGGPLQRPAAARSAVERGRNARSHAGTLLREDRYDGSRLEQPFAVATLKDKVYVAGADLAAV